LKNTILAFQSIEGQSKETKTDKLGERKKYTNTWSGWKSCKVMSSETSDYFMEIARIAGLAPARYRVHVFSIFFENPFVSLVNRRMPMRIVRFWRSI